MLYEWAVLGPDLRVIQLIETVLSLIILSSFPVSFGSTYQAEILRLFDSAMSTRSQVESLLSIIRESAYTALSQYENAGGTTPALESILTHPLDVSNDNLKLKKTISTLEGACEQLCTMLAPPSHTIMNVC